MGVFDRSLAPSLLSREVGVAQPANRAASVNVTPLCRPLSVE